MTLKDLPKMWVQYQTWLKDNGITAENVKERLPQLLAELKKDPSKMQQLQTFINSPQGREIAHKMKINDEEIAQMNAAISQPSSFNSRSGNLSLEQLELIKRYKSGKPL